MDIDDETRKLALLLHYIGSSAFDIFETLTDTGDEKDYKKAMDRLTEHLRRNATLIMKYTSFVKLVNNQLRRSINSPLVCANWTQLANLPLLRKKSNRK
jgi:predicted RND superfamily exporter protein